jgi:hypothetical protein
MKRIVRLTERDLSRIVRRVINEQNEVANSILSQMETLCNNGDANTQSMKNTVYKIKDKATYEAILAQVRTSPEFKSRQGNNYSTICGWLLNEGMVAHTGLGARKKAGVISAVIDTVRGTEVAEEIERHLVQFNTRERASDNYKLAA